MNTVTWRADGMFLASGSDDTSICLWDYNDEFSLITQLRTGHSANILCVRFLTPTLVASCSADGSVRLIDSCVEQVSQVWDVYNRPAQRVVTNPQDEFLLLSCGEDGCILQHDRRDQFSQMLIDWSHRWTGTISQHLSSYAAIHSIASCAMRPHLLLVGGEDAFIWLYDRRRLAPTSSQSTPQPVSLFRPSDTPHTGSVVTSVAISPDGARVLGSWAAHHIFEFCVDDGLAWQAAIDLDFPCCSSLREFGGHSNRRTIKEAVYLGGSGQLIASGSDDGRLFLWHSGTQELAGLGEKGDSHILNAIAPHPTDLCIATGGIDDTVKLWYPTASEPRKLSGIDVAEVFRRNEYDRTAGPFDDIFEDPLNDY